MQKYKNLFIKILITISIVVVVFLSLKFKDNSNDNQIFQGKVFSSDWFSKNIPHWEKHKKYFDHKPDMRGLEIGSFEGRSTLWAAKNYFNGQGSTLEAIDTWEGSVEHQNGAYLTSIYSNFLFNLKDQIKSGQVIPIKARSKDTLMRFNLEVLDGRRKLYDFIFIDGAHDAKSVAEDAILSWDLLKKGGILIFDDYTWRGEKASPDEPKSAIDFFMHAYAGKYEILHKDYQLHIRKI